MNRTTHHAIKTGKAAESVALGGGVEDVRPSVTHRVEVVANLEALDLLHAEWDRLLRESGTEHPFLGYEWTRTWWECFGGDHELHVALVKSGARLLAIAPMMIGRASMYGLPVRRLGTLYNEHTPRGGFIVSRDAGEGVYAALLEHFSAISDRWDVVELCELPGESPTFLRLAAGASGAGLVADAWNAGESPYLTLLGDWATYQRTLRRKRRANLRNQLNRLARLGATTLETVTSRDALDAALDDGFRLEAAAWKGAAGSAILARPELRRFYELLAGRLAGRGALQLQFLRVGERRIAFSYSLVHGDRIYVLKLGYDPELAHCSPGSILTYLTLQAAYAEGRIEYDFLGDAEGWKLGWTSESRAHWWLYLFPAGARGRMLHTLKFKLVPWLRKRREAH